jgi:hypothetical protein
MSRASKDAALVRTIVRNELARSQEKKYYPAYDTGSAIPSTGLVTRVSNIDQGTRAIDRLGDEFRMLDLSVKHTAVVADTYNVLRLMYFIWHDDDVTAPVIDDLLQDTTNKPYLSPIAHDGQAAKQFTILYDKFITVDTATPSVTEAFTINLGNRKVVNSYNTDTGFGHLYRLALSDSTAVSHPILPYHSVLRWVDS